MTIHESPRHRSRLLQDSNLRGQCPIDGFFTARDVASADERTLCRHVPIDAGIVCLSVCLEERDRVTTTRGTRGWEGRRRGRAVCDKRRVDRVLSCTSLEFKAAHVTKVETRTVGWTVERSVALWTREGVVGVCERFL